jgi:hypothetical protein
LRLPERDLPRQVKIKQIDELKSGDYKYRLIIKSAKLSESRVPEN